MGAFCYHKEVIMSEGPDVKIQVVYEGGVFKTSTGCQFMRGNEGIRNSQARKNYQCGQKIPDQGGQGYDVGVHSGETMIVVEAYSLLQDKEIIEKRLDDIES